MFGRRRRHRCGSFCMTLKERSRRQYSVQNRCAVFLKHTQNSQSVTIEDFVSHLLPVAWELYCVQFTAQYFLVISHIARLRIQCQHTRKLPGISCLLCARHHTLGLPFYGSYGSLLFLSWRTSPLLIILHLVLQRKCADMSCGMG